MQTKAHSSSHLSVCVLSGPTATGKSAWAIRLGMNFPIEVVNFDSLLFYRELQIGTARPTVEEMQGIPHHLVGFQSIGHPLDAAQFSKYALEVIADIHQRKHIPLLVGGSGFYLQALLEGMYETNTTPPEILLRSNVLYKESGIQPFIDLLKEVDPLSLVKIHENDHYRIRRSVEHWWGSGTQWSQVASIKKNQKAHGPYEQAKELGWDVHHAYLDIPKPEHWSLIEQRTRMMLKNGLIEEFKGLLAQGFSGQEKPLQSIGYKETQQFLKGEIASLLELESAISISTRQLAKAQRTWFNKIQPKTAFHPLQQDAEIFTFFQQALTNKPYG